MRLAVRRPRPFSLVSFAIAASLGLSLLIGGLLAEREWSGGFAREVPLVRTAQTSRFFDEHTFAQAVTRAEASPAQPMPGARAIIFPHHWLAGHFILSGLRDLAATGNYDRIILLGPDHTNSGSSLATTSNTSWQTPFGLVRPDNEAVAKLTAAGLAQSRADVLEFEHSVAGIVPAIAYYLPGTAIVPLALQHSFTPAEVSALAEAIAPLLDERTVLVAAEDFSHYLPADQARARNAETLTALHSLDSATVLTYGDEHLDSPASIATLLEVMRTAGATTFDVRADTNSAEIAGAGGASVTSYIAGYYH